MRKSLSSHPHAPQPVLGCLIRWEDTPISEHAAAAHICHVCDLWAGLALQSLGISELSSRLGSFYKGAQ